jgi:tetratricopeptide (TPR) repeat protein
MKKLLAFLVMAWLISACDSFRIGGQFAAGRRAFLARDHAKALGYFAKVAAAKPDYVFEAANFRASVWTYLGRCQYHLRKLADARYSLERALTANGDDYLARVFMGLTLARAGDDANGFREMERGLKGLHDWIEYENSRDPVKAFWDPRSEMRKEIGNALAIISEKKPDREKFIASAEWIGQTVEDEIEQVRRQERRRK